MTILGHDIKIGGRIIRIGRLEAEGYHFLDSDPDQFLAELRQTRSAIDLFTFTQRVPDSTPKYNYPLEWDNCAALKITSYDDWWRRGIRSEVRNRARQAEKKGVQIREVYFDESLVRGIWNIYNETPVRGGRRFPHYGKPFPAVYREAATYLDSSFFLGAFIGNTLIGFVKLTPDRTNSQANLMNILSMIRHRNKAPTNALIAHSVKACAARGISYLVYQRFSYGKKPPDGIVKFKMVNGFERCDLPRYYVPLTNVGELAVKMGLHRSVTEHLPEPIISAFRNIRNAWYQRKVQVVSGNG